MTSDGAAPPWALSLRRQQRVREATHVVAQTLREGDKGGHAPGPKLGED